MNESEIVLKTFKTERIAYAVARKLRNKGQDCTVVERNGKYLVVQPTDRRLS